MCVCFSRNESLMRQHILLIYYKLLLKYTNFLTNHTQNNEEEPKTQENNFAELGTFLVFVRHQTQSFLLKPIMKYDV